MFAERDDDEQHRDGDDDALFARGQFEDVSHARCQFIPPPVVRT